MFHPNAILNQDCGDALAGTPVRALSEVDENGIWCGDGEGDGRVDVEFEDGSMMILDGAALTAL